MHLSGHDTDPSYICLVPRSTRPHPAKTDLRDKDLKCYTDESEDWACWEGKSTPTNIVSLGCSVSEALSMFMIVVGSRTKQPTRLVIIADCCFSGIWGTVSEGIAKSKVPYVQKHRQLLLNPVCHQ